MPKSKTRYLLDNKYFLKPLKFEAVYLIQIGRRYCEVNEIIAEHTHQNWFELTLITEGKCTVFANGECTSIDAGDIFFSFPCDIHEIRADKNQRLNYDFFSFYTTDEMFSDKLTEITLNARGAKSRVFQDEKIVALVKNAISEFSFNNQMFTEKLLSEIFNSIIIYIIRNFNKAEEKTNKVSENEILCYQLMNYIDTHIYSLRTLNAVAQEFNYNYSYLSKLFRKTTGQTLQDYLSQRKMYTAKTLIVENKKKIGEIAAMLGYDLYSFSKAFKKKFGVSPSKYRYNCENAPETL